MSAIRIENLQHAYGHRSGKRTVLNNLSFDVAAGEIFGLLGPNGGGKTTLFKILSTMLRPSGGRAHVNGFDVLGEPAAARRQMGVVFQHPSLDKKLTVLENIRHQGHLYGLFGQSLENRCREMLDKFHLTDRAHDSAETLSGGMQRRVEIAKGLLHTPPVLLMDEPSSGLDPGARRELWEHLFSLKKQGLAILLTTHLIEEADRCDRLAILNHGNIVSQGTPDELKRKIGGDVITIHTKHPAEVASKITTQLGGAAVVVGENVRIEKTDGHKFIPTLVEAMPGLIEAITVGKPTLEDVFVHDTGQAFWNGATNV